LAELYDPTAKEPVHVEFTVSCIKGKGTVEVDGECVAYMYKDKWWAWNVSVLRWMYSLPFQHRVAIAANMDYVFVTALVIILDAISLSTVHTVI
jgi:hypothetical protein